MDLGSLIKSACRCVCARVCVRRSAASGHVLLLLPVALDAEQARSAKATSHKPRPSRTQKLLPSKKGGSFWFFFSLPSYIYFSFLLFIPVLVLLLILVLLRRSREV